MSNEDIAQVIELEEWKRNNRTRPEQPTYKPGDEGYGPEICAIEECDNPMPDKRREYGFSFCIECQSGIEHKMKQRRQ